MVNLKRRSTAPIHQECGDMRIMPDAPETVDTSEPSEATATPPIPMVILVKDKEHKDTLEFFDTSRPPILTDESLVPQFRLLEAMEDALSAQKRQQDHGVDSCRKAIDENVNVLSHILLDLSPWDLLDLRKHISNSNVPDKDWRLGIVRVALMSRYAVETEYAKELVRQGKLPAATAIDLTFDEWLAI